MNNTKNAEYWIWSQNYILKDCQNILVDCQISPCEGIYTGTKISDTPNNEF